LRERGSTVPVVMLTGHPLERELEELRAQGMLEWLPKPPRLEELAEVMTWALREDRTGPQGGITANGEHRAD
jgi:DNA-binding response OmpR family regulator